MGTFDNVKTQHIIKSINYNDEQLVALDGLIKWVNKSDKLICVLEGAAGTGKSTIIGDFIKNIRIGNCCCAAPTHKAVRVIHRMTNVTSFTIQKMLGLRPNFNIDNFNINSPQFDPRGKPKIDEYRVIIIDEASMLNKGLLSYIKKESTKHKTKILFVGDPYQLPPVGESRSHVFDWPLKYSLNKIMRQEDGNPLMELVRDVRASVRDGNTNFIRRLVKNHSFINDDNKGYSVLSNQLFTDKVHEYFTSDNFRNNIHYCRYTAFTNQSILDWNKYIRSITIKSNDIIHHDDLVISYSTIVDEFNSPIITNSDEYIIEDIAPFRNAFLVNGYLVKFKAIDGGQVSPFLFIVNHQDEDAVHTFLQSFNTLLVNALRAPISNRSRAWKDYYNYKDNNLLMTSFKDDAGKLMVGKDIDFGYGITVHKTQGSTFDNIFVNMHDILYVNGKPNTNKNMVARLAYVALSRARDNAFILM